MLFMPWLRSKGRLNGLLEHYDAIAKGMLVIEEAVNGYLSDGQFRGFQVLASEVDKLEEQADKIKRRIRNHLPRAFLMEVDKTIFLNFTTSQDNILDSALEAVTWLGMRKIPIPEELRASFLTFKDEACATVALLKPALEATIALVYGASSLRAETKESFRSVRKKHSHVTRLKSKLVAELFNSRMEFKDVYQLVKFVESLHAMSHNAEGCANSLRAMIAR
jgi:predicted phosphate transport protein (TIGR00153 family)